MPEITPRIEGTIHRRDGQSSRFMILADSSSQWGLRSDHLGETSEVVSEMATAAQTATDFFAKDPNDRLVSAEQIADLRNLVSQAKEAADGDSNDDEADATWAVIDELCTVLGIDKDEL